MNQHDLTKIFEDCEKLRATGHFPGDGWGSKTSADLDMLWNTKTDTHWERRNPNGEWRFVPSLGLTEVHNKEKQMSSLCYLVIEYAPSLLDNEKPAPVRMDGHYANREDAESIAKGWAAQSTMTGTRIVVAEVALEAKAPDYWKR